MNIIGKWKLCGIETYVDGGVSKLLTPEEYLNAPMPPYIKTDADVEHEKQQREMMSSTLLSVDDDGLIYSLMPVPAGITKEQLDSAVAAGAFKVKDGLMVIETFEWKEENGVLQFDSKIQGEVLGEKVSPWRQLLDEEGNINLQGMRFTKED